jgi:hypothetical protein
VCRSCSFTALGLSRVRLSVGEGRQGRRHEVSARSDSLRRRGAAAVSEHTARWILRLMEVARRVGEPRGGEVAFGSRVFVVNGQSYLAPDTLQAVQALIEAGLLTQTGPLHASLTQAGMALAAVELHPEITRRDRIL